MHDDVNVPPGREHLIPQVGGKPDQRRPQSDQHLPELDPAERAQDSGAHLEREEKVAEERSGRDSSGKEPPTSLAEPAEGSGESKDEDRRQIHEAARADGMASPPVGDGSREPGLQEERDRHPGKQRPVPTPQAGEAGDRQEQHRRPREQAMPRREQHRGQARMRRT